MSKVIDLTGKRFGRLIVMSRAKNSNGRKAMWNCACDCDGTTIAFGQNLRSGDTKSCGCLQKERASEAHITHGLCRTSTYEIWAGMRQRCMDTNDASYKNYGGRGIIICERWNKFENFLADMGEKPKGLTIERRNNNGNYSPENCFYATSKEQNRNKRSNRIIKYDGKEQCISAWAEELDVSHQTLSYRLNKYPPQFAFNM